MLFTTKNCHNFDHPELHFTCDANIIPSNDVEWMLNFLEIEVKNGIKFKTNETIQIGWMVNQFKLLDDLHLHVLEPDFKNSPILFVDSMTNTLKHLRQQKDVVESIDDDIEVSYTSIISSIVIGETYKNAKSAFLSREESDNSFSGWFFRNLEAEDKEKYTLISLYEFACHRPELVKFLGLPCQYGVHMRSGDNFRIISGEREIPLRSGSFLDRLNNT